MTVCQRVRRVLGTGVRPEGADAGHLALCPACAAAARGFERLDALLLSEPRPSAPPDLSALLAGRVAARRAHERSRARRQLAGLAAAAALVAAVGLGLVELSGPLPLELGPRSGQALSWRPDLAPVEGLLASPQGAGAALLAGLEAGLGEAGGALPSLPAFLPLLLAPLLLLANRALARPRSAPSPRPA